MLQILALSGSENLLIDPEPTLHSSGRQVSKSHWLVITLKYPNLKKNRNDKINSWKKSTKSCEACPNEVGFRLGRSDDLMWIKVFWWSGLKKRTRYTALKPMCLPVLEGQVGNLEARDEAHVASGAHLEHHHVSYHSYLLYSGFLKSKSRMQNKNRREKNFF